jgi:hypothetical protein
MMGAIVYGYNNDLEGPPIDLGPMSRVDARRFIDERWQFANLRFDSAEEAIASKSFGFMRDNKDFLEIDIMAETLITARIEPDAAGQGWLHWLFGSRNYLVELKSRMELDAVVDAYYVDKGRAVETMKHYPNSWKGR